MNKSTDVPRYGKLQLSRYDFKRIMVERRALVPNSLKDEVFEFLMDFEMEPSKEMIEWAEKQTLAVE